MRTSQQYLILDAEASPAQINEVLDRLRDALGDLTPAQGIIGCIAMAIIIQNPTLDLTKLPDMVMDVSRHICLLITGSDAMDPLNPNLDMN